MPTVPHPDPLYPVVWADTPDAPDSPSTPTGAPALLDDDDPFQLNLDEALVRKADNDTVDRWKAFSGPWFDARGEEAAARWKEIQQGLNEIVRRPLGELATTRQRTMYRDILEPRLSAWGDEARAHGEREAQAFNDAESQRRQDLAAAAMRRGARLNDMRAVAEGERRLMGEVRGRSRRQGLDLDAASTAEMDALGAAHSDVVEHLAQHDPQQAQEWLNARGGTIGDSAKIARLHRTIQPYVAEQQEERLADRIRRATNDLLAQHAAVDAMELHPATADGLKQRLADMAEGDRSAAEKEQDAAFSRVMAAVIDPTDPSLRDISADYDRLTPENQDTVRAVMAAKLRGGDPMQNVMPRSYADNVALDMPEGASRYATSLAPYGEGRLSLVNGFRYRPPFRQGMGGNNPPPDETMEVSPFRPSPTVAMVLRGAPIDWGEMSNKDYFDAIGAILTRSRAEKQIGYLKEAIRSIDPGYKFNSILTSPGGESYSDYLIKQLHELRIGKYGPLGVERAEYDKFKASIGRSISSSSLNDVNFFIKGSSITGVSRKRGVLTQSGPNDFDISIVSPSLFQRALDRKMEMKGKDFRVRTFPLYPYQMASLGMSRLPSRLGGRKVTYVIYPSEAGLRDRPGPAAPIHRETK